MKRLIAILPVVLTLAGCPSIPDSTVNALANAGGGCAKAEGMGYRLLVMVAGADKGSIRNGGVDVGGDCTGVSIKDAASVRAVPPVPGTVTTVRVPGYETTTVQPAKP